MLCRLIAAEKNLPIYIDFNQTLNTEFDLFALLITGRCFILLRLIIYYIIYFALGAIIAKTIVTVSL